MMSNGPWAVALYCCLLLLPPAGVVAHATQTGDSAVRSAAGDRDHRATATLTAAVDRLSDATVRTLLMQASLRDRSTADAVIEAAAAAVTTASAATPTVVHLSRRRVALDGDESNTALGRQVLVTGSGFVATGKALCNVSCASKLEGFTAGFLPPRQAPATVLNSTHLTCVLPVVETAGPAYVQVSMGNSGVWSAETDAAKIEYYPLVSLAVGRRPYTTETEGNLLVALAPELLGPASRVTASATLLKTNPLVKLITSARLYSRDNVLPFAFPDQSAIDTDVVLSVSIASGFEITKTRRLVRRVPNPGQRHIVTVDHHTRSLRVDGVAWQGTGWYIFSGFNW